MERITAALAKRDFQNGHLVSFWISRVPLDAGWHVIVAFRHPGTEAFLVDAHGKEPRIFRTLDAAVREIERIGFKVPALFGGRHGT